MLTGPVQGTFHEGLGDEQLPITIIAYYYLFSKWSETRPEAVREAICKAEKFVVSNYMYAAFRLLAKGRVHCKA